MIWYHDVRHKLNRSRPVAAFHTPASLREQLDRDLEEALHKLEATPNNNPKLRPYQRDSNEAVEKAIRLRLRLR